MKGFYTVLCFILFFYIILFPLAAIKSEKTEKNDTSSAVSAVPKAEKGKIRVLFSKSEKVKSIETEEYLVGVVAAEMGAAAQKEALKAQAVASYTFALFHKGKNKNYDVTDSPDTHQKYITKAERQKKWGKNAEEYEQKIRTAVKEVLYQAVVYNGEPILAVYHAVSSGRTENSKNVWGKEYPYLKSVESVGDLLAPDYSETVFISENEFFEKLNIEKPQNIKTSIGEIKTSEGGTVLEIKIANKDYTGKELREIFSLKSASFDLKYQEKKFVFTSRGYGHLVGLSQNGADYMANLGSNYKEILLWYYSGCKIEKKQV